MLDEIIAVVDKKSKEEMTITKGLAFIIIVAAFVLGALFGSACMGAHGRKKLRRQAVNDDLLDEDDFDAGEYVRSLNLDD